ncbi:CASP-like protein 1C1 [Lotus japonicus]|uniref:CASP-like protein 1C1 n=1 Tax=Lotus japonicus TaxID=34305 RepID=UPI00258C7E2D|nr:CASP-like protein 1C1 [Lotus japonicus]
MAIESDSALLPRCLRAAASLTCIIAASLMLTARERRIYEEYLVHVYFGDLAAYWCFVFANYTVAIYSALAILLPAKSQLWRFLVALDGILVVILSSSCSAALAVALLERNGSLHSGWSPICHVVSFYCLRLFLAAGFGFVAVIIYVMLHLLSIQAALNSFLVDS